MNRARYIVVEGPIGVGKTTLVRVLAEEWQARPVLEQVDDNPFLRRFYDDPEKYAFQAQMFFLLTRYRQQQELAQPELFRQSLISDYLFAKDHLFAQINLDSDELALYRQLFHLLGRRETGVDPQQAGLAGLDLGSDRDRDVSAEHRRPQHLHGDAEGLQALGRGLDAHLPGRTARHARKPHARQAAQPFHHALGHAPQHVLGIMMRGFSSRGVKASPASPRQAVSAMRGATSVEAMDARARRPAMFRRLPPAIGHPVSFM